MIGRTKERVSCSEQKPPFPIVSIHDNSGGLSYLHIYSKNRLADSTQKRDMKLNKNLLRKL